MFLFLFLLSFVAAVYILIIAGYTAGWYRLRPYRPVPAACTTRVSVIVPARDEEANILQVLRDLAAQDYPPSLFEVIVVDDHSTDRTCGVVEDFVATVPGLSIRLLKLSEENPSGAYKKKAISRAILISTGELIVTTDADCRIPPRWLGNLCGCYEQHRPKMIIGPVFYHREKSWFEKMQSVEFLSLIGVTAGAVKAGRPIMCNGANLAYTREAFMAVGGFRQDDTFSSGDDVFLLLKIRKKYGSSAVAFIRNPEAAVFTEAKKSLRDFFDQRTRWASKNRGYQWNILFVSATVYFMNLLLMAGLAASAFVPGLFLFLVLFYALKILTDLPLLAGVLRFAGRGRLLLYAFPLLVLYPPYIVVTGAAGIVGGYKWKGRNIRK